MSKIKNLFKGSSLALIVAGLVIAGVASAALVNYLSNPTQATTTVTSPITMSINEGRSDAQGNQGPLNIATTGGSYFTFTTVAKNDANNTISGYPVIVAVATGGDKLTGKEFTKVTFEDKNYNIENALGPIDITDLLYVVHSDGTLEKLSGKTWDNEKLVLFFDNGTHGPYPLAAGEVNWNVITITMANNVVGTYQIYSQYANDLAEYATYQYSH